MPQPNEWTWSEQYKDYWKAEQLPSGEWKHTWYKSLGSTSSAAAAPSTSTGNTAPYALTNENTSQLARGTTAHYSLHSVHQPSASAATNGISATSVTGTRNAPSYGYQPPVSQFSQMQLSPTLPQNSMTDGALLASASTVTGPRSSFSYGNPYPTARNPQPLYEGQQARQGYDFQSVGDESVTYAVAQLNTPRPEFEKLASFFRTIEATQEWKFFVPGRVFKALVWGTDGSSQLPSVIKFGERAYAKVYRFIVVKACPREHWSNCLRISTHGGQAATKSGLDQKKHTIVYTGSQPPSRIIGEEEMNKDPIRIIPVDQSEKLDPLSRVNLAKRYPMEHNIKVKEVGMVDQAHLKKLKGYCQAAA